MVKKYETCDLIITYRGVDIPPYTPVDVPPEDVALWDLLVLQKMALHLDDEDQDGPDRLRLYSA